MSRWKQGLVALPGIGVSILPKLACPACWPAYAAVLSSVGLGFLISTAYLLPLTALFLALALGALAFRASSRRGYVPFFLGSVAAVGVLLGKFVWQSNPIMYGAVGLLVVASLWNAWPRHGTKIQITSGEHHGYKKEN
ncbi:MAG TPA: MerC family mercury resistance protein [Candidatus Dormibacteraeota bacterium]|nr:MerC family mercury resistance protein [Candidatus Dormibacteraeota bacterium]